MLGAALKLLAYSKAPKTTFAVSHPRAALKLKATGWDLRRGYAPRIAALGAAALALPIGYAMGKMAGHRRRSLHTLTGYSAAGRIREVEVEPQKAGSHAHA